MPRHIAEKLRLTSALLGTVSRKDLAAAFRRANPETGFDLGRADKWLQGRSRPRQLSVYDDWSKVLDLGMPGAWVAECDLPTFIGAICARHGVERKELERRARPQLAGSPSGRGDRGAGAIPAGSYVCYSNALSPYYRGRIIRGTFTIELEPRLHGPAASYSEALPTGRLLARGTIVHTARGLYSHLREKAGDSEFFFCLFPPSPPASVLAGYLCTATVIGPDPQPSVTRILMIRSPNSSIPTGDRGSYLAAAGSIAEDLSDLGFELGDDPRSLDRLLSTFLAGSGSAGASQIPTAEFRDILELFDRHWLRRRAE